MTYNIVKLWSNAVIRAYRSSKVSPANLGSSLTSILYFDTSIVMTAMPVVSKNLNENHEDSALPYTATTGTFDPDKHEHLQGLRES